ncbi:MAG: hypothetical protein IPK82_05425 [Polyangiaceae bacterium]|nr:hypothetical protein [Polyangiaceae bacterium]
MVPTFVRFSSDCSSASAKDACSSGVSLLRSASITAVRFARSARILSIIAAAMGAVGVPQSAHAGRAEWAAAKGMALARKGDCVAATPLLEEAELARHKPSVASALAGCYVALGELLRAAELYRAVAAEEPARSWTVADRRAAEAAKQQAADLDARIPTITLSIAEAYEDLDILINGKSWTDPLEAKQVAPDTQVEIEAQAKDTEVFTIKLVLAEGERKVLELRLNRKNKPKSTKPSGPVRPTTWLGARFRGYLMPKAIVNTVFDSGATLFAPGAGLTLQTAVGDATLVFSAAYANYRVPEMPIKPKNTPDTEYEIVESDLQALFATADILWNRELDNEGRWSARIGLGVGVGWFFYGDLYRTQAYPTKSSGTDPYLYAKCNGPNNPAGSFRYCNQLDSDAEHYAGYTEPSWFAGGKLPRVFPFLAFPIVGLSWTPAPNVGIDLEAAASVSGIMMGLGFRYGL